MAPQLPNFWSIEINLRSELCPFIGAKTSDQTGSHAVYVSQPEGAVPCDAIERETLSVDQACGVDLEKVLAIRSSIAASGCLKDLVPLGALLADLGKFDEAEATYLRALASYNDVSPFPLAWVCFQLGMLWGELVPNPNPVRAAHAYERALFYLPRYVHARVHLAEICADQGRLAEAEVLLRPALSSSDPEAPWRLAQILATRGHLEEAEAHLNAAREAFGKLIEDHPRAFADHAAEFYASTGDCSRAIELAQLNAENRPTRRALHQLDSITAQWHSDKQMGRC